MMSGENIRYDAVIGGGGPSGLAMALALAHVLKGDTRIAIVDPARGPVTSASDPRAWSLSASSVRVLEALGIWRTLAPHAEAVTAIEITDSALEAGIRPVLLSYDNETADGEPAAHIVPNQALLGAFAAAISANSGAITHFPGRSITALDQRPCWASVHLDDATALTAELIIAADGRSSKLRNLAGIKTVQWSYDQLGIVTAVHHERPHGGRAMQHFLPGGPFAILPLPGNSSCITWSEDVEVARHIMTLDDAQFVAEVQKRFGGRLGLLGLAGGRASFPLGLHLARDFVSQRLALIGDAAHGVHPIAGQGLNLTFRDIAALAECIAAGTRSGLSFGDFTILERYQAWRRFDSTLSAGTFDALNRLFSNDVTLLRSAREVGLGLVDRLPELKRFFVNAGAGLAGDVPELMRGPR